MCSRSLEVCDSACEAFVKRHGRFEPKGLADLRHVSAGMTDIAGAKVGVKGLGFESAHVANAPVKVVQRNRLSRSNVVHLPDSFGSLCGSSQQIGFHNIFHENKVARGFTVSKNSYLLSTQQSCDPAW